MSISEAEFRTTLSHFASGVTIVTVCQNERAYGVTVSSFCSLSLHPPLVLICLDTQLGSHAVVSQAEVFGVNILGEDSAWLSQLFASHDPDKFARAAHRYGETGVPLLEDAIATLECRIVNRLPGGDHTIFVGEVLHATSRDDVNPLIYYRSSYHRLARD